MEYKATIVILDFMKASRVLENVRFIFSQKTNFEFEVIVIDNSCNKNNAEILKNGLKEYKNLRLIINEKNSGYIKAHNKAIAESSGKYIFMVNPDILFKEELSFQKIIDFLDENPEIGILGPKQINDSGEIAITARAFPKLYIQVIRRTFLRSLPFLKKEVAYDEMRHLDFSKVQDVDWLQSSCFVVRRDLWRKIGGFNEAYFLFMADVELCFETWKINKRVVYYPDVQVYADGKRLSAGGFCDFFKNWILRQHVVDAIKYQLKHFLRANPRETYYKK